LAVRRSAARRHSHVHLPSMFLPILELVGTMLTFLSGTHSPDPNPSPSVVLVSLSQTLTCHGLSPLCGEHPNSRLCAAGCMFFFCSIPSCLHFTCAAFMTGFCS
jgi:hypothetical protein